MARRAAPRRAHGLNLGGLLCICLAASHATWAAEERTDPLQVEELVEDLEDALHPIFGGPNIPAALAAARGLARRGPEAIVATHMFLEMAEAQDSRLRVAACTTLGKIGASDKPVVDCLESGLADSNSAVGVAAARALGGLGRDAASAVHGLRRALAPREPEVQQAAAIALSRLGYAFQEALPPLRSALRDKESPVEDREAAAIALGRYGPAAAKASGELAQTLADDDPRVRAAAAEALARIGARAKGEVDALIRLAASEEEGPSVRTQAIRALGSARTHTNEAVEALRKLLKHANPDLRAAAAAALGNLGPLAGGAVDDLLDRVRGDPNASVRVNAAMALGNMCPHAARAVDDLCALLRTEDAELRKAAAEALGHMGHHAAAAADDLGSVLSERGSGIEEIELRVAAARALGRIGAQAASEINALIGALSDDWQVGMAAAGALGNLGAAARNAIDPLIGALDSPTPVFRRSAAKALRDIALAMGLAATTTTASSTIQDLRKIHASLDDELAEHELEAKAVMKAIAGLEGNPLYWLAIWISDNPRAAMVVAGILALPILYGLVLLAFPRGLLALRTLRAPSPAAASEARLGPLAMLLVVVVPLDKLLRRLAYPNRVLNAWVRKHLRAARKRFVKYPTVRDREVHVAAPIVCDGEAIAEPTPADLRPLFARKRSVVLLYGEGGAGKTSLACQMARWAMSDEPDTRLCPDHVMLPILIEHDVAPRARNGKDPLVKAARGALKDLIGAEQPPAAELVRYLLLRRRLLLIVDGHSELSASMRELIRPSDASFPANALVVTSRANERLGPLKTTLTPLRVEADHVSEFIGAYLRQRGKRDRFLDAEYFVAVGRLRALAGEQGATPLLAKLYAEQMISDEETGTMTRPPASVPDLMLRYVNRLNQDAREGDLDDGAVQAAAKALAWACLKERYRPAPAPRDVALAALDRPDADSRLKELEERVQVIAATEPDRTRVQFTLDPLAEYLAAMHVVEQFDGDEEKWREFLGGAEAASADPSAIRGFLLAVRDCCLTRGKDARVPGSVEGELAKRAGLDTEAARQARLARRVERLAAILHAAEPALRHAAAIELGKMGRDAELALPALDATYDDPDEEVREASRTALARIQPPQ